MSADNRPAVLVTTRMFDAAATALLEQGGCRVITRGLDPHVADGDLGGENLRALLEPCAGWIVGIAHVTRAVLEAAPNLKVVARRGVGYDRVDVAAARDLGKVVTIAAGGNDDSVADHTVGMMLATAKRLGEFKARMRAGDWGSLQTADLYGKTVGLVGLGRIGRGVARRVSGFDAQVLAVDAAPDAVWAKAQGVTYTDLPDLLRRSDFVSLHLPLTEATRGIIGKAQLAMMRPGAIVVCTARGGLIDEAALLAALTEGCLAGAGLDVFEAEDDPAARAVADALIALPNVVATPHAGGSSEGALARGNLIAAQTVLDVLKGGAARPECVIVDGR